MTAFGIFTMIVGVTSLIIAYKIFLKISAGKKNVQDKPHFLEKFFLFFFVSLVTVSVNIMTFTISYSFFWEKAYRTFNEPHIEARVIGYKKEVVKSKNFSQSSYSDKTVLFPEVEYTDSQGIIVRKILDLTSNRPPEIGQKITITDSVYRETGNTTDIDWGMFGMGSVLSGLSGFFSAMLLLFTGNRNMKNRITTGFIFGVLLVAVNLLCMLTIVYK